MTRRASITLFRCPSLSAWITTRQCAFNADVARKANHAGVGSVAWTSGAVLRDACPRCPGVEALRAGRREWPETGSLPERRAPATTRRKLSGRLSPAQKQQLEQQRLEGKRPRNWV